MTNIAGFIGDDMGGVFTRRFHTVMTSGTSPRFYSTMIETDLLPGLSRGMAAVTLSCGLDMLRMLTRLCDAIMTG